MMSVARAAVLLERWSAANPKHRFSLRPRSQRRFRKVTRYLHQRSEGLRGRRGVAE